MEKLPPYKVATLYTLYARSSKVYNILSSGYIAIH